MSVCASSTSRRERIRIFLRTTRRHCRLSRGGGPRVKGAKTEARAPRSYIGGAVSQSFRSADLGAGADRMRGERLARLTPRAPDADLLGDAEPGVGGEPLRHSSSRGQQMQLKAS